MKYQIQNFFKNSNIQQNFWYSSLCKGTFSLFFANMQKKEKIFSKNFCAAPPGAKPSTLWCEAVDAKKKGTLKKRNNKINQYALDPLLGWTFY